MPAVFFEALVDPKRLPLSLVPTVCHACLEEIPLD
jgi:hypothetical protein